MSRSEVEPLGRAPGPGEAWLCVALASMGIVCAHCRILITALRGGVSSDIYRVDLPSGVTVCVKRALPKLKVTANWLAPVSPNRWEAEWMGVAGGITPRGAPGGLGAGKE